MKNLWPALIILTSFFLLASLKTYEIRSLGAHFRFTPALKIKAFSEHQKKLKPEEIDLLELWESMITGRSAPLSKWIRNQYKILAMNHIFTPSGFHLSAVLMPLMIWIKSRRGKNLIYLFAGSLLYFLPGLGALKRMLIIKIFQNTIGLKTGFILAIITDMLWGSFQSSPLSMTYSFLFLGIIYSGFRGLDLCAWFFIAQGILAYFQCQLISPLLFLICPLLNLLFGLLMPILFLLSFPLVGWQVKCGLFILKIIKFAVEVSFHLVNSFPLIEVHAFHFVLVILFLIKRWRALGLCTLILSGSLNLDFQKSPRGGTLQFSPDGDVLRVVTNAEVDTVFFRDVRCKRKLVRGIWDEKCSSRKRSTFKKL